MNFFTQMFLRSLQPASYMFVDKLLFIEARSGIGTVHDGSSDRIWYYLDLRGLSIIVVERSLCVFAYCPLPRLSSYRVGRNHCSYL